MLYTILHIKIILHLSLSSWPKQQNSTSTCRLSAVAPLSPVAKRPWRFQNPHVPHPSPQPTRWSSGFPASVTEEGKLVWEESTRARDKSRSSTLKTTNYPSSCHGSQIVKAINGRKQRTIGCNELSETAISLTLAPESGETVKWRTDERLGRHFNIDSLLSMSGSQNLAGE